MFDAYTVKKVLPRLFAAVILIQLSWFLFTGFITLVNSIAYGIEGLIYAPFGGSAGLGLMEILQGTNGGTGLFLTMTTVGGATAIIAAIAVGGIMTTAGIVLLAVLIAFLLLLFRQVIIIALLIISPLAIVAWILPGTEKYWKMWWESFSKLLFVYPIILGMVAIGRVMAKVTGNVDAQGGLAAASDVVNFFLVLICLFGPFFLIPKTFQMAGAAFASLAGGFDKNGRGAFERLKKRRSQTQAKTYQKFKEGERFSRNNIGARAFNRLGAGVGAGAKGHFGVGAHGEQARAKVSRDAMARQLKENSSLQQFMLADDDGGAVMALSGGTHAGAEQAANQLGQSWLDNDAEYNDSRTTQARRQEILAANNLRRDQALAAARSVGLSKSNSQAAFQLMMQNKARSIVGGEAGQQLLADGIGRLHPNNAAAATEASQSAQYFAREGGRSDLGGTWGATAPTGENESLQDGFNRTGAYKVVRGHTTSVQAHADDLTQRFNASMAAGDEVGAQEAAARMIAMRNGLGQDVSEENKAIVYSMLQDAGVDHTSQASTDEQFGDIMGAGFQHLHPLTGPLAPGTHQRDVSTGYSAQLRARAGLYEQGDPARRGTVPPPSDRRLKKDIIQIGTSTNGIAIYKFRYLWSKQVYLGVMAQDLISTHPEALGKDEFGFYVVDYAKLGMRMMTIEEWDSLEVKTLSLEVDTPVQ